MEKQITLLEPLNERTLSEVLDIVHKSSEYQSITNVIGSCNKLVIMLTLNALTTDDENIIQKMNNDVGIKKKLLLSIKMSQNNVSLTGHKSYLAILQFRFTVL
jgi:hypothetical protein